MSQDLKSLKDKLDLLEKRMRDLLASTQEELEMARKVQSILMPNRLSKFHGLESYAKYISARELSSEFYDLIPTENNRCLWIVQSWTSNFGLGSLITQSFMNLQSRRILGTTNKQNIAEVFGDILATVGELHEEQTGNLRLMLRRLDMSHLLLESAGFGFPPPLVRNLERNEWAHFQIDNPELYAKHPAWLTARSYANLQDSKNDIAQYQTQLRPGSRFFLMGSSWNPTTDIGEFFRPLNLEVQDEAETQGSAAPTGKSSLLDDLNFLVLESQDHLKKKSLKADICLQAFETDKKLLHLA